MRRILIKRGRDVFPCLEKPYTSFTHTLQTSVVHIRRTILLLHRKMSAEWFDRERNEKGVA